MTTRHRHRRGGVSTGVAPTTPAASGVNPSGEGASVRRDPASQVSATRMPAAPSQHRRTRRLPNQPPATQEGDEDMLKQRVAPQRITADTVLLTFKEAMDFLRVSRSTLYRLMWSGQLRGHKVGSTWRFYESDLLAAVASPDIATDGEDDLLTGEGLE